MRKPPSHDMLEVMVDHRCDQPACPTCDLFLSIPDSDTPEFEAWQAGIRTQLLTDPYVLRVCPDLVLWLLNQEADRDRTA